MFDCYMRRYGSPSIVVDRFNRANGYLGNADSGQAWLTGGSPTTSWVVSSNVAKLASVPGLSTMITYIDYDVSNVTVSADITITYRSQGSCILARLGSSYDESIGMFVYNDGTVSIVKRDLGGVTVLATGTYSHSDGGTHSCSLSCIGNDFTASIDGVVRVSVTNDNALKTNTKVGMFLPITGSADFDYFDNFVVRG